MGRKMQYRYFSEDYDPYDEGGPRWDTAHPRWYETIEQFEAGGSRLYDWNAGPSRKQPSRRLIDFATSTVVGYAWHRTIGKKAKAILMAAPVTERHPE